MQSGRTQKLQNGGQMKLYTDDEQFDILHKAVDKSRKNAKEVKVSRKALLNLLMDHANMYGVYEEPNKLRLYDHLKQMGELDV